MKYRKFGKLDWEVSVLGFGAMRLPFMGTEYKDYGKVNETETTKMIRHAIDQGVNYLDTAYVYHLGNSEVAVGKALKEGYREKVKLATKLPPQAVEKQEDCDKVLNEQLKRLQMEHIDFYLLHGLNKASFQKVRDLNIIEWAEKAITDGRIGHLGFSFHDNLEVFKEIIDAYDKWTFCQIQYNYMDVEYQAGTEGLQYASGKGLAVVIMEPLRGGNLSKEPPESVKKMFESAAVRRTPAEWSFQWVWHHPEVSVALSGMSTMQDVVENLESADRSDTNHLSTEELAIIDDVRKEFLKLSPTDCTGCQYCMPCPSGVAIPVILANYNEAIMYDNPRIPRFVYGQLPPDQQADKCEECLECEEKCPQGIEISKWLNKAHEYLGPKK